MRGWLLRLLGATRPVVIDLDVCAVAKAGPGDLVILRYAKPLKQEQRQEVAQFVQVLRKRHPGVRFLILDDAWGQVVTATEARSCADHAPLRLPFGSATRDRIADGDTDALLRALIALSAAWLGDSGVTVDVRLDITATACVGRSDPRKAAMLAAGVDLLRTLELSPQGREAIANFCGQPFLQKPKGE